MTKVIVYHEWYGCDTGCCDHAIYVDDNSERVGFEFGGADSAMTLRQYAEQLVTEHLGAEHVADLDWDQCIVLDESDC